MVPGEVVPIAAYQRTRSECSQVLVVIPEPSEVSSIDRNQVHSYEVDDPSTNFHGYVKCRVALMWCSSIGVIVMRSAVLVSVQSLRAHKAVV